MLTKKKLDAVYAGICPKCGGIHLTAAGTPNFNLDKEIEKLIQDLFHDRDTTVNANKAATKVATTISSAVAKGYAKQFYQVAWDSPDNEMLRRLQTNVFHFSFAKTHQQLVAMSAALVDPDGKEVPFDEFREIALRINNEINVRHLATEHATAIASSQMASRWVQFEQEADTFPNLTYRTVGDSNVRPSHARLDGITRPIKDPFWKGHYPPLGWGCRCDVEQSTDDQVTPPGKIPVLDDIPPLFRANFAQEGVVFPKDHPYYDHLPESVLEVAGDHNPFQYTKLPGGKKGGYIWDNALHKGDKDERSIASILSNAGEKVIFLPEIDPSNEALDELRKLALPKALHKTRKTPDAKVGAELMEFKTCQNPTANAISMHIRRGAKQAARICIRLVGDIPTAELKKAIKGRVIRTDVQEVWIISGKGKLTKYTREQIEAF